MRRGQRHTDGLDDLTASRSVRLGAYDRSLPGDSDCPRGGAPDSAKSQRLPLNGSWQNKSYCVGHKTADGLQCNIVLVDGRKVAPVTTWLRQNSNPSTFTLSIPTSESTSTGGCGRPKPIRTG